MRRLAAAAAIVALAACARAGDRRAAAPSGELWLDVFVPYPRARALCDERLDGHSMDVAWRSYATADTSDAVVAFYKQAHPTLVDRDGKDLVSLRAPGEKALAVMEAGRRAPSCGEPATPGERTIIVVSQAFPHPARD